MRALDRYARLAGMTDEAWRRHANPWSVWTRFAGIPLMILAIWSRAWIGWWAPVPCAVVVAWLWWNPRAFPPIDTAWSSKGIFGERLWLQDRSRMPADFLSCNASGPSVLLGCGQLWRIDRLGQFYAQSLNPPAPR